MIFNLNEKWYRSEDDVTSPAGEPQAARCQGRACGDVEVTCVAGGYDVSNSGSHRVRVSLCYLLGDECTGWTQIDLEPGETRHTSSRGYCIPYCAEYR